MAKMNPFPPRRNVPKPPVKKGGKVPPKPPAKGKGKNDHDSDDYGY